jgi:hypothetical protein
MSTVTPQATRKTAGTHHFSRADRKLGRSRGRTLTPAWGSLELAVGLVLAAFVAGYGWPL